jgi:hypothetical protein
MTTLESLAPTRAYRMDNGEHVHARCADAYALRLDFGPYDYRAAFMCGVKSYHAEGANGIVLGRCAMCGKPVRGMARASLRGVQVERAL